MTSLCSAQLPREQKPSTCFRYGRPIALALVQIKQNWRPIRPNICTGSSLCHPDLSRVQLRNFHEQFVCKYENRPSSSCSISVDVWVPRLDYGVPQRLIQRCKRFAYWRMPIRKWLRRKVGCASNLPESQLWRWLHIQQDFANSWTTWISPFWCVHRACKKNTPPVLFLHRGLFPTLSFDDVVEEIWGLNLCDCCLESGNLTKEKNVSNQEKDIRTVLNGVSVPCSISCTSRVSLLPCSLDVFTVARRHASIKASGQKSASVAECTLPTAFENPFLTYSLNQSTIIFSVRTAVGRRSSNLYALLRPVKLRSAAISAEEVSRMMLSARVASRWRFRLRAGTIFSSSSSTFCCTGRQRCVPWSVTSSRTTRTMSVSIDAERARFEIDPVFYL